MDSTGGSICEDNIKRQEANIASRRHDCAALRHWGTCEEYVANDEEDNRVRGMSDFEMDFERKSMVDSVQVKITR